MKVAREVTDAGRIGNIFVGFEDDGSDPHACIRSSHETGVYIDRHEAKRLRKALKDYLKATKPKDPQG